MIVSKNISMLKVGASGFNAIPYLEELIELAENELARQDFSHKEVARGCINSCQRDINRILSGENLTFSCYDSYVNEVEIPDDLPF